MPNPAFIVGTATHSGLENFHKGITREVIFEKLREELLNGKETTPEEIERFGMARNMIEAYIRNPVKRETIETEFEFRITVPGIEAPLHGFVDRLVVGGFVEYKTSIKVFKQEDIETIQTDIYSFAHRELFGTLPLVTYCILHKKKSKKPDYKPQIMEITKTEDDMLELIRKLKVFEQNIKDEIFPATPGYHCKWCDYSGSCKYK